MTQRCDKCKTELVTVDDSYNVYEECPLCSRDDIITEMGEELQELRRERELELEWMNGRTLLGGEIMGKNHVNMLQQKIFHLERSLDEALAEVERLRTQLKRGVAHAQERIELKQERDEALADSVQRHLAWVTEQARRYGWLGDYVEVMSFLEELHHDCDVPVPDLTPYPKQERE